MAGIKKDKGEGKREKVGVTTENYRDDNTSLFYFKKLCC